MSDAEDREDVAKVQLGDAAAFEGIVTRWQRPLVNLAWRFCRDRGRAEEMAQEAFLRAFRSLNSWRQQAAFSTWLFVLAANVYRNELRRMPPPEVSLDAISEPADSRVASGGIEEEQPLELIHRAVAALPAKYRDVILLFYFQEMNLQQAARSLALPEGTVKIRLYRAREILRKKLRGIPRAGFQKDTK